MKIWLKFAWNAAIHSAPAEGTAKFCNDACRTAFNNKGRKEPMPEPACEHNDFDWRPAFYDKVNPIIRRNRYIMECLCEIDYRAIEKYDLEGYGFNFKYFSSEYHYPEHGTYRFCYDHGYQFFNDRMMQIVSRTEEILC
jgi:hypothetical protein